VLVFFTKIKYLILLVRLCVFFFFILVADYMSATDQA
jgi:hypothetical protein